MKARETKPLWVDDKIYLFPPAVTDIPNIVKFLQDKEIYENTLHIPYPYTEKNGNEFIIFSQNKMEKFKRIMEWGIFLGNDYLIGMVGFIGNPKGASESDEVGYWIGKPYWNQGIMTKVLNKITEHGFHEYKLKCIELKVFVFNDASCRVAEKSGYKLQGLSLDRYQKDNRFVDVKIYTRDNLK